MLDTTNPDGAQIKNSMLSYWEIKAVILNEDKSDCLARFIEE
jgi:hypothetical protein